jgi:hypothetical protein
MCSRSLHVQLIKGDWTAVGGNSPVLPGLKLGITAATGMKMDLCAKIQLNIDKTKFTPDGGKLLSISLQIAPRPEKVSGGLLQRNNSL